VTTAPVPTPARGRDRRTALFGLLMASPPVVFIGLFIGFPVVSAILYTLGYAGGPNSVLTLFAQDQHLGFVTLAAYRAVFADPSFIEDLLVTVLVTVLTVVFVLLLAWSVGLYLRLTNSRAARALSALAVVPLFIPVVIASYAILGFYAADGFPRTVAALLGWDSFPTISYTMTAVTIGEVWTQLPFGVLLIASGLQGVPNALIEAARDAGAGTFRIVRSILIPMNVLPSVIVGTFSAIYVLGSFTVPYLIGPNAPNLLGTSMTYQMQSFGRPQQAEVMAVVVFLVAAGIGAAYVWANVRNNRMSGVTQ
jgi:ABC-type spermidine/putrescine transport system permease subunit I